MSLSASTREPVEDREVTISRVIDAPANVLFEAYANPERVKKWFGPKGWPLTLCEMDFRVGGRFRFAMTGPNGKQNTPFGGEYLEIVPNEKIVFDNGFELPGAERMIVTFTYHEVDGKTTFTVHTLFSSAEAKNKHIGAGFEIGYNSAIDQLEEIAREITVEVRA